MPDARIPEPQLDPVGDRLSGFGISPVPPLAATSEVRTRGDRRRRRSRAALQQAGPDPVQTCLDGSYEPVGDQPSPGTECPPVPEPTPSVRTGSSCLVPAGPDENVCPEGPVQKGPPPPPPPPPALPSSSASPLSSDWDVTAAFLTPADASSSEEPVWAVDDAHRPAAGPLLDPCSEQAFPLAGAVEASDERALVFDQPEGDSRLVQEVFRYASSRDAASAFEEYAARVERCPVAPSAIGPEGYTERFTVVAHSFEQDVQRLLVQVQPCAPDGLCTAHYSSYLFVAQTADGLTAAYYGRETDGDPVDAARALLDSAAQTLATAVEST